MIYFYDKQNLQFKKINRKKLGITLLGIFALLAFSTSITPGIQSNKETITIVEHDTVFTQQFSEENLIRYMKELNIKYPHIVLAQARIESGTYTSNIFKENHNLFGMKKSYQRASTATGIHRGHAEYAHWTHSVIDYALWQNKYLSRARTESEYYEYLGKHYAEADHYIASLKAKVKNEKLEDLVEYTH